MNITEQAAQVLAEIDEQLAICDKATIGVWQHDESEMPAGKVKHTEGYLVATFQMRPDAAFIASARTVCPKSLRCLKTAIEVFLVIVDVEIDKHGQPEAAGTVAAATLNSLITQWNSK